jgi:hypothetical protein
LQEVEQKRDFGHRPEDGNRTGDAVC